MGPRSSRREEQRIRDRRGWASFTCSSRAWRGLLVVRPWSARKRPREATVSLFLRLGWSTRWQRCSIGGNQRFGSGRPVSLRPSAPVFCFLSPTPTVRSNRRPAGLDDQVAFLAPERSVPERPSPEGAARGGAVFCPCSPSWSVVRASSPDRSVAVLALEARFSRADSFAAWRVGPDEGFHPSGWESGAGWPARKS